MPESSKLTEAVQTEALTRPTIGGKGQGPRQVGLDRELDGAAIKKARADLASGKINLEQFDQTTKRK
ncbi:hypothetical protein KKE48_06020 [Patescibacteria group bacterium]|nr:hypothetical protein [Patescibacteria group bacterium]MBU1500395.1 hypothetical protein [Patescibacteria group bacterium]